MVKVNYKNDIVRIELGRLLLAAESNGFDFSSLHYFCNIGKSHKQPMLDFEWKFNIGEMSLEDFLLLVYLCGGHIVFDDNEDVQDKA